MAFANILYINITCSDENAIPVCSPVTESIFMFESWILHSNQCPDMNVTHLDGDVWPQRVTGKRTTNSIAVCVLTSCMYVISTSKIYRTANSLYLEAKLMILWGASFYTLVREWMNRCVLAAVEMSGVPHQNGNGSSRWQFITEARGLCACVHACQSQSFRGSEARKTGHRGVTNLHHTLGLSSLSFLRSSTSHSHSIFHSFPQPLILPYPPPPFGLLGPFLHPFLFRSTENITICIKVQVPAPNLFCAIRCLALCAPT